MLAGVHKWFCLLWPITLHCLHVTRPLVRRSSLTGQRSCPYLQHMNCCIGMDHHIGLLFQRSPRSGCTTVTQSFSPSFLARTAVHSAMRGVIEHSWTLACIDTSCGSGCKQHESQKQQRRSRLGPHTQPCTPCSNHARPIHSHTCCLQASTFVAHGLCPHLHNH